MILSEREFCRVARTYLGTPWHHAARAKGVGIDCIGLVAEVYREMWVPVADRVRYSQGDEYDSLIAALDAHCDSVVGTLRVGDILVFRSRLMDNHCALYLGDGLMIHAYSGIESYRVIEHPISDSWLSRLVAVYRARGVEWQR